MTSINKYEGREFLFNDGRGNLFSKAYFKNPYNNPINPESDDIVNSVEYNIMTSEYYITKQAHMLNDDIHNEFIDLIIKAALLHRRLDKSSEIGTRLNSARAAIKIYSNLFILGTSDGAILTNSFLYYATVGKTTHTGSYFLKLIANFLTNSSKTMREIDTSAQLYINNMMNGVGITPHSQNPDAEYTLNEVLNIIHAEIPNTNIKDDIKSGLQEEIVSFFDRMYAHIESNKRETFGGDVNKTFEHYYDEKNLQPLAQELENVVMTKIKSIIIKYFNQYTKLSDPVANGFWKNVYLKWNMMDKQTQNLYTKVISLQKLNTSTVNDYSDVNESDYKNNIPDAELSNYRLNLKKASDGSARATHFEYLLPFIPSTISGFWYTDYQNKIRKFDKTLSQLSKKNLLKIIYNGVYFAKNTTNYITINIDNAELRLPATLSNKNSLSSQFGLNVDKLTRQRLYLVSKLFVASDLPLTTPSNSAQYIDLEYKNIWTRNADGKLSKNLDGKEVIYGEMNDATINELNAQSNCFTTQLKFNDNVKCDKYIHKCLLDDDADGLNECLTDYLQHDQFFKVAEHEVDNMHPLIALRTLQKFGFHAVMKYDNKAKIQLKKIQSIDDWLNGFMAKRFSKKELQKVFTGNKKNDNLLSYLKLVINHVNRNPAILNKDFKGTTEEKTPKEDPSSIQMQNPSQSYSSPTLSTEDIARLKVHLKTDYESVTSGNTHIDEKNGIISGPFGLVYSNDYGLIPPFLVSSYASDYNIPGMRPQDLYGVTLNSSINDDKYMSFSQFQEKIDSGYFIGAKFFGDLINHHLNKMKESGKELLKTDILYIQEKLQNQLKLETELIKTIKYFEEYRKGVDYFKNYESETISEKHITKLIDNKSKLLAKKSSGERTLVELLAAIDAIEQNADDGSYSSISADVN